MFQFGQVERLIRSLHGVPPGRRSHLLGRFKYFQRMPFPNLAKFGKSNRPGYSFQEVLELVCAFAMVDAGTPPALAAGMVRRSSCVLRGALMRGWLAARGEMAVHDVELMLYETSALSLDPEVGVDQSLGPLLFPWPRIRMGDWSRMADLEHPAVLTVLDPVRIVAGVRRELGAETIDPCFEELGPQVFGRSARTTWARRAV